MNLAVLLGAKRILLLGYDMKFGPNGERHWHKDHAGRNPAEAQLQEWREKFATMVPDLAKAGVEVINCSRDTALDMFPKLKLEEAL